MDRPPHPFRIANFRAYWAARFAMTLAQNALIIVVGWQTYTIARGTMSPSAAAAQLGLIGFPVMTILQDSHMIKLKVVFLI